MDTNTIITLLLLLAPFAGFLINVFFGKQLSKNVAGSIGTFAVFISFLCACYLFGMLTSSPTGITITFFEWFQVSNVKIDFAFLLDQLSVLWLLFVTGIGT